MQFNRFVQAIFFNGSKIYVALLCNSITHYKHDMGTYGEAYAPHLI